jgi:hypothetical protein
MYLPVWSISRRLTRSTDNLVGLLSLGENWVLDGSSDPKGERQPTILQRSSGEPVERIGEEALLGENLCYALIVKSVGARHAETSGAFSARAMSLN